MFNRHRSGLPLSIRRVLLPMLAGIILVGLVAGCGGGSDSASSTAGSTASTAPTDAGNLSEAKATLQKLYANKFVSAPPTESPAPAKGKKVWLISVGLGGPSTETWANTAKEAAEALGWEMTIFDSKFSPALAVEGVTQAIAAGADGIILNNIDCAEVKAPLEQAKKAGIVVSGLESIDCSEANPQAPSLIDTSVVYNLMNGGTGDVVDIAKDFGQAQADWVIAQSEGEANVLLAHQTGGSLPTKSAEESEVELEACPGCTMSTLEFSGEDLAGSAMNEKLAQALLQNPEANWVIVPYDDVVFAAQNAIAGAGRPLQVIGSPAAAEGMTLIRSGKTLSAAAAYSLGWESYAAVDDLNRAFAGEKAQPSGIGLAVVDQNHNVTASGGYRPPYDFAKLYREAWGVG